MRAIILAVGLVLLAIPARAEGVSIGDTLKSIPGLKQGIAWSLVDSKLNYLTTIDLVQYKGFNLEGGIAADAENTGIKAVVVISYDVVNLKKLGVTVPVLDLIDIRLGAYAGYGRIEIGSIDTMKGNNEFDYGLSATFLKLKF